MWAKWGRFVIFPVLCLPAFGDTALKSEFFNQHLGHTKRAVTMTLFVLLSQHLGISGPPNTVEQAKTQNDKSTLFNPPPHWRKHICFCQKGRKGAGVKGAGVANCRIFRSAVPSVVVWSILLVSLSGVKKKL